MQKDLSTVSFVYLAASALSADCVYLINVYKAKREKTRDPQSQGTVQPFISHRRVGGQSGVTGCTPTKVWRRIKQNNKNARILLIKGLLSYL